MREKSGIVLFFAFWLLLGNAGEKSALGANGSVLTVKETQIEVFLGLEDGIYPEQELYIVRGRKLLGKLKVTFVGEATSWGEITSLEAGVVPVPGDQVTSSAPHAKSASKPATKTNTSSGIPSTPSSEADKNPATSSTTTTSALTPALTTQQKEFLSKKETGRKGKIYLVVGEQAGITLGRKDGLKEGDEVLVFQGNETVGKVKVKTLFEDYSLCDMMPSGGKTFKNGDAALFNPLLKVDDKKSEQKTEEKKDEKKDDKKDTPPSSTP